MGHILLLSAEGHGSRGFTKSRLEAFRHALRHHEVSELSVNTATNDFQNPFHSDFKTRLDQAVSGAHAVVTCGPFHPLLALPQLPKELPVWVDLPSDPLADIHSQWLADPHTESTITAHAMAKLALESAMVRGDQFGLISPELRLSFLGQLLLFGRRLDHPHSLCHVTPITQPLEPQLSPPLRQPKGPMTILLSGHANTWLDSDSLSQALRKSLQQIENLNVEITGGPRFQNNGPWEKLIQLSHERFTVHGWLSEDGFVQCIERSHVGLWLDAPGIEPLLGCRTRGVTMLHHRRSLIATASNQWHEDLARLGVLRQAKNASELVNAIHEEWKNPSLVPEGLLSGRTIDLVFKPLVDWLDAPSLTHHAMPDTQAHFIRLKQNHHRLLNSPSIRGLNWIHRKLKKPFDP